MNTKIIIRSILILFIAVSAGYLILDSYKKIQKPSNSSKKEDIKIDLKHNIIIYYFHTTKRCYSCKKIESLTEKAVREGFKKELSNGILIWKTVNLDDEKNKHFADDYNLATKSVILAEIKNNKQIKWKNLNKVWEYLNDDNSFIKYIQKEINEYLEKI